MSVLTTKEIMEYYPTPASVSSGGYHRRTGTGVRAAGKKCVTYDEYIPWTLSQEPVMPEC